MNRPTLAPAAVPLLSATLAVQLAVAGAVVWRRSAPVPPPPPPAAAGTADLPALDGVAAARDAVGSTLVPRAAVPGPVRDRVRIGALRVDAPVVPLGTLPDGELEVPATASDVGIWSAGAVPGDTGPSVLVGHVDLDGVRGVFHGLRLLRPGDRVDVARPDGRLVSWRVDRVERHRKDAFPTEAVYGPTDRPALRLVTCGGGFDRRTGHYVDNVVVFASPA